MRPTVGVAILLPLCAVCLCVAAATGPATQTAPAKAAPPAKPAGSELHGRVTGDGGVPIPRAVIRVLPDGTGASRKKAVTATSGEDGAFAVSALKGSSFRIRVEAKGYAPSTEASIPAGATLSLRLKRGFSLSGIVLDRATRKPVNGASVFAWEKDAEIWGEDAYRKAGSGPDGRFTIQDVPPGKATVEARAAAHAATKTTRLAGPDPAGAPKPAPFEMLLDPAGTLTGRVTDVVGTPVAGAEVTAYWRDATGDRSRKATSDADGHYGIPAAAEVRISRMTASAKGFPTQERLGGVPSDGIVDFLLEHGGTLAGAVTAADGKAPTFRVLARRERGDDDGPRGAARSADREFSDPSGSFRIEDLDPGTYAVEIEAKGYATIKKTGIELRPEQVADLGALRLVSSSTMRGRVVSGGDQAPSICEAVAPTLCREVPDGACLYAATRTS